MFLFEQNKIASSDLIYIRKFNEQKNIVDIINKNDKIRNNQKQSKSFILCEFDLSIRESSFSSFIYSLVGISEVNFTVDISAGVLKGKERNIAWRILDTQSFGLAQQEKRLYLLATDKKYNPESVLFEEGEIKKSSINFSVNRKFEKEGCKFEINKSVLYLDYFKDFYEDIIIRKENVIIQDEKIRLLSPLEYERLMGLPDNCTNNWSLTLRERYNIISNSSILPIVEWIGFRINQILKNGESISRYNNILKPQILGENTEYYNCKFEELIKCNIFCFNTRSNLNKTVIGNIEDIITPKEVPELSYIPSVFSLKKLGDWDIKEHFNINNENLRKYRIKCGLPTFAILPTSSKWLESKLEK